MAENKGGAVTISEEVAKQLGVKTTAEAEAKLADLLKINDQMNKYKKQQAADGQAWSALRKAYAPQYKELRIKFWKAAGLDPSGIK